HPRRFQGPYRRPGDHHPRVLGRRRARGRPALQRRVAPARRRSGMVEFSESGDALVGANFAVYQSVQVDVAPRLLAVGEYKDVVEFSGATATYKAKKVILDTSVLQDVFVYPL